MQMCNEYNCANVPKVAFLTTIELNLPTIPVTGKMCDLKEKLQPGIFN